MHTFQIGEAFSGGIKAFSQKALPLIAITTIGGLLILTVQFLLLGNAFMQMEKLNTEESSTFESSMEEYSNILENFEDYDSPEEATQDIAKSLGLDYEKIMNNDGQMSTSDALDMYMNSNMNPLQEINLGKSILTFLITTLIGIFMGVALATTSLDAVFSRKFELSNITKNFSKIPSLILFSIIISFLTIINFIPPILGSIFYIIIYLMVIQAPFIILEEGKGVIEAMKESRKLMEGNKLRMFGFIIILSVTTSILSLVTFGLGVIIIAPASVCIVAHIYKQLTQGPAAKVVETAKQAIS